MNKHFLLSLILTSSLAVGPAGSAVANVRNAKISYDFDLVLATERGDLEGVVEALKEGANVNQTVGLKHEPVLHLALQCLRNEAYRKEEVATIRSTALNVVGSVATLGILAYIVKRSGSPWLVKKTDRNDESISQQLFNAFMEKCQQNGHLSAQKLFVKVGGGLVLLGVANWIAFMGFKSFIKLFHIPQHYWIMISRMCVLEQILDQPKLEKESIVSAIALVDAWHLDTEGSKVLIEKARALLEHALERYAQVQIPVPA